MMTQIAISSIDFDLFGHMRMDVLPSSDMTSARRRVNRIETLDGGVALNDFGYSHGDRTFLVSWKPSSRDRAERFARIFRTHSRLTLCCREGAFLVAPEGRSTDTSGVEQISFLVVAKLSPE